MTARGWCWQRVWWCQLGSRGGEQPEAVQDTMEQGAGQIPGTPWMELEVAGVWTDREIGAVSR